MKEAYKLYNVRPVYEVLNELYDEYPLANKPIVMAHAECNAPTKYLIFLDTDILCWREPTEFYPRTQIDLMLSPDATKTVASAGPGDPYEQMWQELLQLAGVTDPPWTTTHLTGQRVRCWWMSSVIVSRRASGFMRTWLKVFSASMNAEFFVPEAYYLREQMTICAISAKQHEKFAELPVSHNFPIQNFAHPTKRVFNPREVCLWHYQPFLNRFFRRFAEEFDAIKPLDSKLAFAERQIKALQQNYSRLLGLDETLLQKWRRDLRLGPRIRAALGSAKPTDHRTEWR
jgi:hypothetical protein